MMKNLQVEFETLAKHPDSSNTDDRLKFVALALWYEDFVPDIEALSGVEAAQAGYLLDKLSRYNCLPQAQKEIIRTQLLSELKQKSAYSAFCHCSTDLLAKEWGASAELKKAFKELLNFQRRSYKSSHTAR